MKICQFPNCDKKGPYIRNYCDGHYSQLQRNNFDRSKLKPLKNPKNRDKYYQLVLKCFPSLKTKEEINRRHEILKIKQFRNPFVNGENRIALTIKYENSQFYKTCLFSRHLMELKLLRHLDIDEQVDHKDENKNNDHISNLQILTRSANVIKSRKFMKQSKLYEFICPICSEISILELSKVKEKELRNKSGPTCSKKCGTILSRLFSLNNGKFKTSYDDVLGRFIDNVAAPRDRQIIDPSENDIKIVKKWRQYFKDRKNKFYQLVKNYYKNNDARDLTNDEVQLGLKLLSRYQDDRTHLDLVRLFQIETLHWLQERRLKFLIEVLYRFDAENNHSDMSYKLYKYFDL